MGGDQDFRRVMLEFARTILNPFDVSDVLHRLSEHTMAILDARGAGLLLQDRDGHLRFAAASEERIIDIERYQETVSEGACFEAYERNEVVLIQDVAAVEPWPGYRERVLDHGFRAVIGVPMNAFGRTIGVINVYREQPGPWSSDDVESVQLLAAMGAGYLAHAHDLRAQLDLTEQLQYAIDSRDVIGQAKGILMARQGIDEHAAFDQLRELSQHANRKLRDIATDVRDELLRAQQREHDLG